MKLLPRTFLTDLENSLVGYEYNVVEFGDGYGSLKRAIVYFKGTIDADLMDILYKFLNSENNKDLTYFISNTKISDYVNFVIYPK